MAKDAVQYMVDGRRGLAYNESNDYDNRDERDVVYITGRLRRHCTSVTLSSLYTTHQMDIEVDNADQRQDENKHTIRYVCIENVVQV